MTKDEIALRVRRRVRLERLAAKADLDQDTMESADDAALARAFVGAAMPALKERADKASGEVLDTLVDVAAADLAGRPAPQASNPFEVRAAIADARDEDEVQLAALRSAGVEI